MQIVVKSRKIDTLTCNKLAAINASDHNNYVISSRNNKMPLPAELSFSVDFMYHHKLPVLRSTLTQLLFI